MEKQGSKHNPESIREFINHFQKSRILLTAFELDIFTILEKKPRTSDAVSKKIKANARATDRLMNAVCAIGFLEKREDKFFNSIGVAQTHQPSYLFAIVK